jgi:hypothetical protein
MKETPNTPPNFSQQDIDSIAHITNSSDTIPLEIREQASTDIIKTLENNHPLNKIWRDDEGKIIGYLGFEDFSPNEAYAKYLATEGLAGENPFSTIPDLIEQAKELGYTKIHFHGFNKRLNKVLTHFGFKKTGTDVSGEYRADHFEIKLEPEQPEVVKQKIREGFEHKYLNHLVSETEKTLKTLKGGKKESCGSAEQSIQRKLSAQEGFDLSEKRKLILKLKLARYFQRHDSLDENTLADALLESPKWLDSDKGGFDRLLEVHEQKTLEKIAEMRRKKAEQTGDESFNPYEALFETTDGKYYLARLLNMPHLAEESQYMNHCVGTSDSYINKMKKGDVEILSFRKKPIFNQATGKLEGDEPIITIEYNIRTKTIEQIKKASDNYLSQSDPFFADFIETLKKMRDTEHDNGEKRDFQEINSSEMQNIEVKDYHIFTENGEVSFRDFDPESNALILKLGKMDITPDISKIDQAKIIKIVAKIDCEPEQIANGTDELSEKTLVYIGPWNPTVLKSITPNVKHIYESFPNKKVFLKTIEIDPDIKSPAEAEKELLAKGFVIYDIAKEILQKTPFSKENKEYNLVSFSVENLGFPNGATTQEIYQKATELGLEICPAEVGPLLRLNYPDQPNGEYLWVAMESIITSDGNQHVFSVRHGHGELKLNTHWDSPGGRWDGGHRFVFLRRK